MILIKEIMDIYGNSYYNYGYNESTFYNPIIRNATKLNIHDVIFDDKMGIVTIVYQSGDEIKATTSKLDIRNRKSVTNLKVNFKTQDNERVLVLDYYEDGAPKTLDINLEELEDDIFWKDI